MSNFRFHFLALTFFVLLGVQMARADDVGERKHILILYGERLDLPAIRILEQAFRERFGGATSPSIDWYSEYFDFARFPAEQNDASLTRYIHERYAGRKIDLVLPVTVLSLNFVLKHRDELFPKIPIVFLLLNPKDIDPTQLPPDVTGVAAHQDVPRTMDLALQLQPAAKEIVVVSGSAELDKKMLQQTAPILDGLGPKIKWRAIADRSLSETIEEVKQVPAGDIVLILTMLRDREGRSLSIPEITRQLVPVSKAPVYGITGTILGYGAVGGALLDFASVGGQASDLALNVLRGDQIASGSTEIEGQNPLVVDWRALQHWKLPVSRVPAEATVMFRQPTLWEEHRGAIIGIIAVSLAQSATITGLLIQRARRRKSEESLSEREKQMSLVSQSANLGLWVRDVGSGKVFATEKFRQLLGFAPDEAITFESVLSHLHPEDRDQMKQTLQRAIDEKILYDTQYRVVSPDGSERWISSMVQAQYDRNGKPTRILGVSIDITQRRRSEQEVQELRRELAHVDRVTMLGQLASALAHELSQPLGAILRNAEAAELFLKMEKPDIEEVLAILVDIRKDDQRAGQVIDRMRSLMKRRVVDSQVLDVVPVVEEVISLIRADATTRRIVIRTQVLDDLPPVRGDRVQLQQVLLNLLLNGMDALAGQPDGERYVTVRVGRDRSGSVEIAVSDTGHGIPTDKVNKLFEPFYTTKAQGMGVGLAISRTIVEAHGGRIWAENNMGQGAIFRMTLPAVRVGVSCE